MQTPAGKDQLPSASNRVLSGINVVIAAETVLLPPTTESQTGWRDVGCADVRARAEDDGEALVGGPPFVRAIVVFLQIGTRNI
jgi:hypothetical protein